MNENLFWSKRNECWYKWDVSREGKRWSEKDEEILIRMFQTSKTPFLAKILQRTTEGVLQKAAKMKLRGLPSDYETVAVAAKRTGYSRIAIINMLKFADLWEPIYKEYNSHYERSSKRMEQWVSKDIVDMAIDIYNETESIVEAKYRASMGESTIKKYLNCKQYGVKGRNLRVFIADVDALRKQIDSRTKRINWPSTQILLKKVNTIGIIATAKELNCTIEAIRHRLKYRKVYHLFDKNLQKKLTLNNKKQKKEK